MMWELTVAQISKAVNHTTSTLEYNMDPSLSLPPSFNMSETHVTLNLTFES